MRPLTARRTETLWSLTDSTMGRFADEGKALSRRACTSETLSTA